MATKPPAKAAPKSAGKAATKPAAKKPAAKVETVKKLAGAAGAAKTKAEQEAIAKKVAEKFISSKFKAEQDGPVDRRPATAEELADADAGIQQAMEMNDNMRKHGTIDKPAEPAPWEDEDIAEQQAELNSLSALMASARADITPADTARPEPAPSAVTYREAVNVERRVNAAGPGSLSMSDLRSSLNQKSDKPVHSAISRLFKSR